MSIALCPPFFGMKGIFLKCEIQLVQTREKIRPTIVHDDSQMI
jgi:hypothetical protein